MITEVRRQETVSQLYYSGSVTAIIIIWIEEEKNIPFSR